MKILIAIDSSRFSHQILDRVAKRRWPRGTEFRIVTAVELSGVWDADQQFLNQCQIILAHRVDNFRHQLPANSHVTGEVAEGRATSVVTEIAKEWQADLIVIGSHGDTGARRPGLGSVAAAIVDTAPCSVEVIKLHKFHHPPVNVSSQEVRKS
jgi:hypothetical protein